MVIQKTQAKKLILVDIKNNIKKEQQMKQHIYRAYIMSIYQLEATIDYLITIKFKKSSNKNITLITKQIQLQLDNKL